MNWQEKLNAIGFPKEFKFSEALKIFRKEVQEFSGFIRVQNGWIAITTLPYIEKKPVPTGSGETTAEALVDLYNKLIEYGYQPN